MPADNPDEPLALSHVEIEPTPACREACRTLGRLEHLPIHPTAD